MRSIEHRLKLERLQGPPQINKLKDFEMVFYALFVYSVTQIMKTKRVYT